MNTSNIKAVLFDMDGTLVDTEPIGPRVMTSCLIEISIIPSDSDLLLFDKVWRRDGTEVSINEFVRSILKENNSEILEFDFLKTFYSKYEEEISKAPELAGATELLKYLAQHYLIALVTASTRAQALTVLEKNNWSNLFNEIVTQDEYITKKPNPAGYIMAAEKLGISPENCIVVEDSKNGVVSGRNAGMYVIGVRAGNEHSQDLTKANEIVDTLLDVQKSISKDV